MTQPNLTNVDNRLLAALHSARQRDASVLTNADHLAALLADLAPDVPSQLREACVAAARSNATEWLTHTPPYTQEQVSAWLRSQYPHLRPEDLNSAVGAFSVMARSPGPQPAFETPTTAPAPSPNLPAFNQPTVASSLDRPPLETARTEMPEHPSAPIPTPWPPPNQPHPSPASGRQSSRRKWLPLALVAVLLVAGGVVATVLLTGKHRAGTPTALAAPQHVTVTSTGFGALTVSWRRVPHADYYVISDQTGNQTDQTVRSATAYTFPGAAAKAHLFEVRAVANSASYRDSRESRAPRWNATLPPPAGVTAHASGNDITVSWDSVIGASSYQLTDLKDSSIHAASITTTSYTVSDAIYAPHEFAVKAVAGATVSAASTPYSWAPVAQLSAAEATLAYKLPSALAKTGSCTSDSNFQQEKSSYLAAVISCEPSAGHRADGPSQLFAMQVNPGEMQPFESNLYNGDTELKPGCANTYPTAGTRYHWYFKNTPNTTVGDTYCFVTNTGDSVFAWTYNSENIVLQIQGSTPTTRTGLHSWWSSRTTVALNS